MTSSWLRIDCYRLGQGHDHNEGCLAGSRWAGDGSPCPQEILGINPRVLPCYAVLSHFSCVRLLLTLWAFAARLLCPLTEARILEWVANPFSRGSSWHREWAQVSHSADRLFTIWATREASHTWLGPSFKISYMNQETVLWINQYLIFWNGRS